MKRQLTKLQISFQIQKDLFYTAGHQQCVKSIRKGYFLLRNLAQLSIAVQQCVMPHPRLQSMKRLFRQPPLARYRTGRTLLYSGEAIRYMPIPGIWDDILFLQKDYSRKKEEKGEKSLSVSYTHLTLPTIYSV